MAAVTTVVVEEYNVNPMTGFITVSVHCHTVDGSASWDGPSKQYGLDVQQFRDRFAGDIDALEAWVANEHRSITGPPTGLVNALRVRKGKVIG
jgi:hypothetical protein